MKLVILAIYIFLFHTPSHAQVLPEKMTVVRGAVEYPPMEFYRDGKLTGFHIELIQKVANNLGIEVTWLEVPWRRALYMVQSGQADAISYIGKTNERAEWAIFDEGNIKSSVDYSFLITKENESELTFEGDAEKLLDNRSLLIMAGFLTPPKIKELNITIHEAPEMINLVQMLLAGRADVALVNKLDYLTGIGSSAKVKSILLLEPPVYSTAVYIAFSKKKNLYYLSTRFSEEMTRLKTTKEYQKLVEEFLPYE